jgi:hypothetical protein
VDSGGDVDEESTSCLTFRLTCGKITSAEGDNVSTSYTRATARELHTSDVEAPCPAAACCRPQQVPTEGVGHGASARPFPADLSADLDWTIAAIEKEQALAQPNAIRLRYLRAMKAQLERAI